MNAYTLNALKRRGIAVSALGCVMQDVEPVDLADVIPEDWCYHSQHPDRAWISGRQDGEAHVTLLYGLLENAHTIREDIDEVLDGWEPGSIVSREIEVFDSPFPDEPYSCIVARLDLTSGLRDAHARLSFLPHINTYPEYKAHVTLAYVHRRFTEQAVTAIEQHFGGQVEFTPTALNYGYEPED